MKRELTGVWRWVVRMLFVAYVLFHLYTAGFALLPLMQQRGIHAGFAVILCLLTMSAWNRGKKGTKVPIWDIILIIFMVISIINLCVHSYNYAAFLGDFATYEYILGVGTLVIVLEVARRSQGWVFPILTLSVLFYTLFGPIFPGRWAHAGQGFLPMIQVLYGTQLGMWGYITGISATVVALFLILGAILQYTGGGETFVQMANLLTGKFRGGPALISVVSSALFGMISGSAVANVATTGNFTIPTMKKCGFPAHFAGAVETTASTGGQFTPPVMGAGAFIMADMLGMPYLKICLAAAIPAFLYYVCVYTQVMAEAQIRKLPPMPKEEIPRARDVFNWRMLAPFLLPILMLFFFLFQGYNIWRAVFWACIVAFILYIFTDLSWTNMKGRLLRLEYSLEQGARSLTDLVPLLVCANIVIALLSQTGVAVKLSSVIMAASGTSNMLALALAAVVVLILGMGIPTTAAYVIGASVCGVALTKLGFNPLAVQMFIFYYACISVITPPVCLAAYTAAGIAQARWSKIAFTAMRLGIVAYLVPFVFIYLPELLWQGSPSSIFINFVLSTIGVFLMAIGFGGWFIRNLHVISRIFIFASGFLLLYPGFETALMSIPVVFAGAGIQWLYLNLERKKLARG